MAENRGPQYPEENPSSTASDVVVIGAGLAGKAAAIRLARAGMNVTCISPAEAARKPVGESLDWSAPELLKAFGFPMERLIEMGLATWKRHVTLETREGCSAHYVPKDWLGKPPLNIELKTLHVDRQRLDQELLTLALQEGVKLVRDRVSAIERSGNRVMAVRTAGGATYSGTWFIDASGIGASVLGREFDLPHVEHGPTKVTLWSYFSVVDPVEGTTLYMDPSPRQYLDWVWEIPVNPQTVSVGVVLTGDGVKERRGAGLAVEEIYRQELAKFARFESFLSKPFGELNVTSFKCRAYRKCAGPNWLICGEAAAMVDPITSNGVTAALRHAAEASALILKYRTRGRLPLWPRVWYSSRILQMAKFFNSGIEKIVYEPPVRNRIGVGTAGTVYTTPAWSMNVVYARLKPFGMFSTLLLNSILCAFRLSAWAYYQVSRRRAAAA